MAHRLLWRSLVEDRVAIFERGSHKKKGDWRSDAIGERVVLRGEGELRTYYIREWLSPVECRATLESVVYTYKELKSENC